MSYYVRIEPPGRRRAMRFSSIEVRQILIAVTALTIAFALALGGGLAGVGFLFGSAEGAIALLIVLAASFVAVVTAFLLHELAHKAVAQRYGCAAEFRYYPMGLVLGLLTAAFGFIFAAPGAVVIAGSVTARQNVRISAAGPGTNLGLAALFIALAVGLGMAGRGLTDVAASFVRIVAFVNVFLGGFNLIPFPPLDGSKIFAFDKVLWVMMIVALVAVGATGFYLGAL